MGLTGTWLNANATSMFKLLDSITPTSPKLLEAASYSSQEVPFLQMIHRN